MRERIRLRTITRPMEGRSLRRILVVATVFLVGAGLLPPMAAGQEPLTASRVRLIRTSRWVRPSPDPVGLAYHRVKGRLIVVDSEVEETRLWERANIWFAKTGGTVTRWWSLARFSIEPTDVAFKDRATLFIADDNRERIFRLRRGPDGTWGTRDDAVRGFSTRAFGSLDPEGLEFARGSLFVTDGNAARVFRILPGPDRVFNGVRPAGDDVVRSFGTLGLGLRDPEDLAYDRATGLLYLISRIDDVVVRTNLRGQPVDTIDLSSFGLVNPAGVTFGRGSSNPSAWHLYLADRGIDNDVDNGGRPDENDGRIFEFALSTT
jgi:hypothetical protein